jgi:hypothetical protein
MAVWPKDIFEGSGVRVGLRLLLGSRCWLRSSRRSYVNVIPASLNVEKMWLPELPTVWIWQYPILCRSFG